jgi:tetratricopeptide (TPR) repeat protein
VKADSSLACVSVFFIHHEMENSAFPTLGVRVSAFRTFIETTCGGANKIKSFTTSDICKHFVKPLTGPSECSYCELLQLHGNDGVAQANVFISHAWKFKFLDVVEAIEHHFRSSPEAVVWFDLFSNNQHAAPNFDFDWWSTTFKNAIFLFNHTVLILFPWEDPIPLTRAWCLWEIYCTINTNSKFEIAMCASERESFLADIQVNFCPLSAMIARVDVAKADAYRVEDKERIFSAVQKIEGGVDHVNSVVFQTLRNWAIETMRNAILLATGNERVYLIGSLAIVYRRYGMYDLAEPCARYSCECAINKFGKQDPFTLKCQNELVLLLDKRGKHVEACECARVCWEARKKHIGPTHPDTLSSMNVYGNILCTLKRYNEAEPLLLLCYENIRAVLGGNHQDTLKCMFTLANLYFAQGKYELAEPLYSRYPDSEHCKHFLMAIHASQGKYEETRDYYKSHYEFSKIKLGVSHPETLIYMHNLALIYCCMDMPIESIAMFRECVDLRKTALGVEHPDTLQSMFHLGRILQSRGYFYESAQLLNDTLEGQVKLFGPNHPDTQATRTCVDEVALYMPVLRYLVPVYVCPMYLMSYFVKFSVKSMKCLFNPTQLANVEDLTFMVDSKDELSIDEYNARQLLKGGAPLADECPIAAFISEVAPKAIKAGQVSLTQGALMSAVAAAFAPELDSEDDAKNLPTQAKLSTPSAETSKETPAVQPPRPTASKSAKRMSEMSTAPVPVAASPQKAAVSTLSPPSVSVFSPGPPRPDTAATSPVLTPSPFKKKLTSRGESLANVLESLPFLEKQESALNSTAHAPVPSEDYENGASSSWTAGLMNIFTQAPKTDGNEGWSAAI